MKGLATIMDNSPVYTETASTITIPCLPFGISKGMYPFNETHNRSTVGKWHHVKIDFAGYSRIQCIVQA